ncbi:MAG TPA: galactitol-1-phosphate 5-dehydrogenase [Dysgonamonadaceae bacterium]|nr:galactitol-1-phosphate 5-dehydrogenase [Dysgonamonadaceae bacterium]
MEVPEIEADEVLLQIKAAGICGSDVPRVYTKGTYNFPTVLGHEFAGEIIKVNPGDEDLLYKKAAVFPLLPCRECAACQIGEYAQCTNYDYYGSRRDGGFSEYLAVKKWNLVIVPDEVSYTEAAMCEPVAVAVHALQQADMQANGSIAIFGVGTIGNIVAQLARGWGAKQIIPIDVSQNKIDFLHKQGFDLAINSIDVDPIQHIDQLTNGRGVDLAIDAAGVSATIENCLKVTRSFGQVVCLGNPNGDIRLAQNSYWEILRKQLVLRGTWNSSYNQMKNDWQTAIDCMHNGILDLEPLITHRYSLEDCNTAFETMRSEEDFLKVMFVI